MAWSFIEPEMGGLKADQRYSASYIRKQFTVESNLQGAQIQMTALGVYHVWINGKKVNENAWLLPGFTNYEKRVQYQVFDIGSYLKPGKNVFLCVLGDGWYRGAVGSFSRTCAFGTQLKLAVQLEMQYCDESRKTLVSDESWIATQNGPLRKNDLKLIEEYDARLEEKAWNDAEISDHELLHADKGWHACRTSHYNGEVVESIAEPVREHEQFGAAVLHTPNGETVVDFGQNHTGHIEFCVEGHEGQCVELLLGETLDPEGNFTIKNLEGEGRAAKMMPLGQRVKYTLREGTQTYRVQFLTSGYRYALVKAWPGEVKADAFRSFALYTPMKELGHFSCSNAEINQLIENVRWSMKSNFVDIPTDCPHRERAGWTGDVNVFADMANYLADTRLPLRKWMADLVATQDEKGGIPNVIPDIPMLGRESSSAGWTDVAARLPLKQYWYYGEKSDMEAAYQTAKKYVDLNVNRAGKKGLKSLFQNKKYAAYILDTGFHYGEWLEPDGSNMTDAVKAYLTPDAEVATAWFYDSAKNVSIMAGLLGKTEDEKHYKDLSEEIKRAYQAVFLTNGIVHSKRQCKYVRPLSMGLIEAAHVGEVAKTLNELCIRNQYHVGTGFLTTYRLLQVLTDHGYADTAYRILENEDCPGWLYEVKKGATTTWEGWKAIDPSGKLNPLSQNHFAPGAALSWLFSHCAGLQAAEPGFKKILVKPIPGGSLTWVNCDYETPHGMIRLAWKIVDREFQLELKLPEGVSAEIVLPNGEKIIGAKDGCYACRYEQ
ncbi:MAG: family 78 glycoside hydrolase catalytic domain [Eubacteriales bacterium]|nr:family 78 glycoside hydrolase catalytic domain [Eubacteriales bacterium]